MKVTIVQMADPGKPRLERLLLRVDAPTSLGSYCVLDTVAIGEGMISAGARNSYWFPNTEVKEGDNVILYTGPGTNTFKLRPDGGGTDYFFYWGKAETLWGAPNARATLLEATYWATSKRPQTEANVPSTQAISKAG